MDLIMYHHKGNFLMKFLFTVLGILIFSTISTAQWERTNGPEGISCYGVNTIGDTVYSCTATDGIYASTDDGVNWFPLNSGIEYAYTTRIVSHNGILITGTDNGVYRSTNHGQTWIPSANFNDVYVLDMVTLDQYIFIGTISNGVLRSSDDGVTWEDGGFYHNYCTGLCTTGNKLIATGSNYTMYTTDYGATWYDVTVGVGTKFSLYSRDNLVFVGARDNIFRSTDYGSTFSPTGISFERSANIYDFTSIDSVFYCATSFNGVYKSTNNGVSWLPANEGMGPKDVYSITYTGSSLIAGTHYSGNYRSSDGGEMWMEADAGFPAGAAVTAMTASGSNIYAGTRDGIFRTTDNGDTWTKLTGNDTVNYAVVREIRVNDSEDIFLALQYKFHGVIYKSTDLGTTWTRSSSGLPADLIFIFGFEISGDNIIAGTDQGIYYSSDGGGSWLPSNVTEGLVEEMATSDGYVYAAFDIDDIYRSQDDGVTWQLVLGGSSISFTGITAQNNVVYASGFSISFHSTDYGNLWEPAGFPSGTAVYGIAFVPQNLGMVLAGTDDDFAHIYAAFNFTDFFSPYSEGLGPNAVPEYFTSNDTYSFAGTNNAGVWRRFLPGVTPVEFASFEAAAEAGGVILKWRTETEKNNRGFDIERKRSADTRNIGGTAWKKIGFTDGNGTTTEEHSYSFTDPEKLTGKYSYRLKQIDFDGSYNYSQEAEVEVNLPGEYSLEQNYPNPFNPATIIEYSIPAGSNVKLRVYNSLGEEILTLVNAYQEAGIHKVNFDAAALSSGIYYYRLEAVGSEDGKRFTQVNKMMVLK